MTGTAAPTTPPTPGILSGATSTKVKVKVELDDKKIEEKEVEKKRRRRYFCCETVFAYRHEYVAGSYQ